MSKQRQPPPPGSYTLPAGTQLTFDPALLDNVETGWVGDYPQGPSESELARRKKLGLCPHCGTEGRFDRSLTMICPEHGPY
jgi:hypothetical protein